MRGKDVTIEQADKILIGSLPRARERPPLTPRTRRRPGITPACAGKTSGMFTRFPPASDHSRVRGKDQERLSGTLDPDGSLPRARERHSGSNSMSIINRITPACAGKTRLATRSSRTRRDHSRVRGKDVSGREWIDYCSGSLPRARERLPQLVQGVAGGRITPACAGKTPRRRAWGRRGRDHSRVRGKDPREMVLLLDTQGSLPRARERRSRWTVLFPRPGITPACAGKTGCCRLRSRFRPDHSRVRGKDMVQTLFGTGARGSLPRARERHAHLRAG